MTVRVHTLFVDACSDEDVAAANALLSDDERRRRDKFVFQEHARLYALAHGLVRRVLSEHLRTTPAALRFVENQYGKPSVEGATIDFNLSHTKGLVAVGITDVGALGVDVETMDRRTDTLGVAQHSFSDVEASDVTRVPEEQRSERFFRYWTLKESYIKARGMGLHCPLKAFSFLLDDPFAEHTNKIRIAMRPDLGDWPERWYFEQRRLRRDHFLAVCIERLNGVVPPIEIVPHTKER
ncbi:MAG: 4'-phosphopantetheinyl transferase superfamily protein [Deltaproteobacteria bacterium]|nr:4'-phosphopantetheinyl transferase superfamily protein [Deltaproteobacteria bacterium]